MLIRRLRGPAFLLLVGIIALLAQAHVLSWGHSWPLYLILAGVLLLAERAALAAEGYPPPPQYGNPPYTGGTPYQGAPPYQGVPYPGAPVSGASAAPPQQQPGSSIVPAHSDEFDHDPNGGQS
jgi:hypothetical protein